MESDEFSEKQIAPSSTRSEEETKPNLNESEDEEEVVPAEVAEALE